MPLAHIIAAFVALTNPAATNCATIDNGPNVATWTVVQGTEYHRYTARYRDNGGSRLAFDRPVPRQVRLAEAALQVGRRGHKIVTVCA